MNLIAIYIYIYFGGAKKKIGEGKKIKRLKESKDENYLFVYLLNSFIQPFLNERFF